jgi:hypothetical protein
MRAQRCAKVINYLGTVPNALNKTTREKNEEKQRKLTLLRFASPEF